MDTGVHVQNVSGEYTLVEADIDTLDTANANIDVVYTTAFTLSAVTGTLDGRSRVIGKTQMANANINFAENAGKYATSGVTKKFIFFVAKSTYADIAAAKAGLAGTKLYYQLATQIITQYGKGSFIDTTKTIPKRIY
jgi:hypothetical protein